MQFLYHIAEEYRQWRHPRAFRIPALSPRQPQHDLGATLRSLRESIKTVSDPAFLEHAQNFTAADDQAFITDFLTRLWRLRKSLLQAGGREPMPDAQRAHDQLERLFSRFEAMDFRIEDREGDLYDAGLAMKVISSEPMEGIGREVIKETYKPGIYRGSHLIQTPEVIIGLPIIEPETKKDASAPAEAKTEGNADAETEAEAEAETETETEAEAEAETEAEAEAEAAIQPEAEAEPETAVESNSPTAAEDHRSANDEANEEKKSENPTTDESEPQSSDESEPQSR